MINSEGTKKWTEAQEAAIKLKGGSLLVSAAAGSGKTAVLVERVIRLITDPDDPVDIDRLLIVTFTNAAALELQERIRKRLTQLIIENPSDRNLRKQKILLNQANISTIHSFCLQLLKSYHEELNIPFDFRLSEGYEIELLEQEVLDELLEQLYEERMDNPTFVQLINQFNTRNDDRNFKSAILNLYHYLTSIPFPADWLKTKQNYYKLGPDAEISATDWAKALIKSALCSIDNISDSLNDGINILKADPILSEFYLPSFMDMAHQLNKIRDKFSDSGSGWDELSAAIHSFKPKNLSRLNNYDNTAKAEYFKNLKKQVTAYIRTIASKYFCYTNKECVEDILLTYPLVKELFDIIMSYDRMLSEAKRQKKLYAFYDLEQLALTLLLERDSDNNLRPSELAREISDKFHEIMVDEYQDTNRAQDAIFKAISKNETNLFIVGDIKQSIYRFRQAEPLIFLSKKNSFTPFDPKTKAARFPAAINLANNFRSRKEICSFINFFFKQLMQEDIGEISYDENEQLVATADYPQSDGSHVSFELIDVSNGEDEPENEIIEARFLAKRIKEIVGNINIKDDNGLRPARFSDISILLRYTSKTIDIYKRELQELNIPVITANDAGLLDSLEIKTVLSILYIIDNPLNEIALTGAMLSPVFGFTPGELSKIRMINRETNLYFCLKESAEYDKKSKQLIDFLDKFRILASHLSIFELLQKIYSYTDIMLLSLSTKNGKERELNLQAFLEYVRKNENVVFRGLNDFVIFISNLKQNGKDLPKPSLSAEASDAVRIMSIHRSKGLEFPICILAGSSKRFNQSHKREMAVFHNQLGFAAMLKGRDNISKYSTLAREAVINAITKDNLSEEMRLLYVAFTRAKEYLIITGCFKDLQSKLELSASSLSSRQQISSFRLESASSAADWILTAMLRHPAAKILRERIDLVISESIGIIPDSTPVNIKILSSNDYIDDQSPDNQQKEYGYDSELLEKLRKKIEFCYENTELFKAAAKLSVSELVKQTADDMINFSTPEFLTETRITPAKAGSILHLFMENLKFERGINTDDQINYILERGIITKDEIDSINKSSVAEFLSSGLFERIVNAKMVEREFQFSVLMDVTEVNPEMDPKYTGNQVFIQGVVDCLFEEEDGLVIVDYKTDRLNRSLLVQRYKKQLDLYAAAVEKCLEKKVIQKIIYSLHLNKEIEV